MTYVVQVIHELSWHEKVAYLGTRCLELPQTPTPLRHIFEPGVYIREMDIPAGTVFIGRPHRFGHRIKFISGKLRWITPDGDTVVDAPWDIHTSPGTIGVVEAITDVVARTYHPNPDECRDTDLMENLIFHPASEMKAVGDHVANKIRGLLA